MTSDNLNENGISQKESCRIIRSIYNHLNEILFLHDLDGNFILTNTYFKEFTGYSILELETKNLRDLIPDKHQLRFEDYLQRIRSNGYDEGIIHMVTKEGHAIAVEYKSALLEVPENPKCVNVICRENSEGLRTLKALKESQKKLKEREQKYRDIFENINEYIFLHDMDGYFVDTNTHFRNNIGFSKSELHRRPVKDLIPEQYKPAFDAYLKRITVSGYEKGLLKIESKNGRELLIEYKNSLVQSLEDPLFVRGVGRDITLEHEARKALKKSEEDLRIARDELEKRVQERTKELRASNKKLEEKTLSLEEANISLRVLLTTKNEAKREIEERMLANIKRLILPFLRKIKSGRLGPSQLANIEMIESNLNQTTASFDLDITSKNYSLSPTEIQVAILIREGKSSKEIAMLLNTAVSTIHTHRDNIRIKLGIKNKKINLRTNLIG